MKTSHEIGTNILLAITCGLFIGWSLGYMVRGSGDDLKELEQLRAEKLQIESTLDRMRRDQAEEADRLPPQNLPTD